MSDIPNSYGEGMAAFEKGPPQWVDETLLPDIFNDNDPMYLSPDRERAEPVDFGKVDAFNQGVSEGRNLGYEQALKDIETLGQGES